MTLPLGALLSVFLLNPALDAQEQEPGYVRTYVIRADAAWVAPGKLISPAFVQISEGRIDWVATMDRRVAARTLVGEGEKPPLIEVEGTLAPGVVDAWCTAAPGDFAAERRPGTTRRMRDALPALYAGEDTGLAAEVMAARQAGVAAVYLTTGTGALRTGVGTAAGFAAMDLPMAAGREALDCAVGSAAGNGLAAGYQSQVLYEAFAEARDWRESQDDYADQLEKYEKDLAEYEKKLDEYVKKEEKSDKDKAPPRPKRPKAPVPTAERGLLLDAMDGKLQVRVRAETVADLRAMLGMAEDFDLELVLVGGLEADLIADELAAARVPVVLPMVGGHDPDDDRALAKRFQRLHDAGVDVALASGGGSAAQARLLSAAGELVAAGVDADAVWAALTTVPAAILGLDDEVGRIARGHAGSLLLFEGASPFDASAPFKTHKPK